MCDWPRERQKFKWIKSQTWNIQISFGYVVVQIKEHCPSTDKRLSSNKSKRRLAPPLNNRPTPGHRGNKWPPRKKNRPPPPPSLEFVGIQIKPLLPLNFITFQASTIAESVQENNKRPPRLSALFPISAPWRVNFFLISNFETIFSSQHQNGLSFQVIYKSIIYLFILRSVLNNLKLCILAMEQCLGMDQPGPAFKVSFSCGRLQIWMNKYQCERHYCETV